MLSQESSLPGPARSCQCKTSQQPPPCPQQLLFDHAQDWHLAAVLQCSRGVHNRYPGSQRLAWLALLRLRAGF
ncbi:Hypothetical predicted protein [Podarcis lilfordi]|uniref:Uncharacterized protein n=1 Tax=Podarcis lilfordi TaxID=74358 RepID=A0AA35P8L9_9SAUR|nr:Hypothetical predicted protein [Podarcis lilfordi]